MTRESFEWRGLTFKLSGFRSFGVLSLHTAQSDDVRFALYRYNGRLAVMVESESVALSANVRGNVGEESALEIVREQLAMLGKAMGVP